MQGRNFVMRSKEDAHDYRYFPEPDLLTLALDEKHVQKLKDELPELPGDRIRRLMKDYGLPFFDANLFAENLDKCAFFEACAATGSCKPKNISNWVLGDISRILNERNLTLAETKLTPERLCSMVEMIEAGKISGAAGKVIIELLPFEDKTPDEIVAEKGLAQISDASALEAIAGEVLAENVTAVEQYKAGKTNVIGFLVGQCMKRSKGQGNPAVLKDIVLKLIGE